MASRHSGFHPLRTRHISVHSNTVHNDHVIAMKHDYLSSHPTHALSARAACTHDFSAHSAAHAPCTAGLFRTQLGEHGQRTGLREAFHALRHRHQHQIDSMPNRKAASTLCRNLYGAVINVSDDPGEGTWELVNLRDDVFLIISDCRYAQPRTEAVLPEGFVELHFVLQGCINLDLADQGQIQVSAPNFTAIQQTENQQGETQDDNGGYQVFFDSGRWRSVALYVDRHYMKRFLHDALDWDDTLNANLDSSHQQLQCQQIRLDVRTLTAVEQLLANPYSGQRRLLYADAKVTEILCASVERWQSSLVPQQDSGERFSARDLRLIEKARELLVADLSRPPTIPQLARSVGVNTSKLKRGFKYLCGMTIFEYAHRHRMERALQLLSEERMPVNQVADRVGYQHQTSFTASFKAHFGFTPKQARHIVNNRANTHRSGLSSHTADTGTTGLDPSSFLAKRLHS